MFGIEDHCISDEAAEQIAYLFEAEGEEDFYEEDEGIFDAGPEYGPGDDPWY